MIVLAVIGVCAAVLATYAGIEGIKEWREERKVDRLQVLLALEAATDELRQARMEIEMWLKVRA